MVTTPRAGARPRPSARGRGCRHARAARAREVRGGAAVGAPCRTSRTRRNLFPTCGSQAPPAFAALSRSGASATSSDMEHEHERCEQRCALPRPLRPPTRSACYAARGAPSTGAQEREVFPMHLEGTWSSRAPSGGEGVRGAKGALSQPCPCSGRAQPHDPKSGCLRSRSGLPTWPPPASMDPAEPTPPSGRKPAARAHSRERRSWLRRAVGGRGTTTLSGRRKARCSRPRP
jgi:hypothetical protein